MCLLDSILCRPDFLPSRRLGGQVVDLLAGLLVGRQHELELLPAPDGLLVVVGEFQEVRGGAEEPLVLLALGDDRLDQILGDLLRTEVLRRLGLEPEVLLSRLGRVHRGDEVPGALGQDLLAEVERLRPLVPGFGHGDFHPESLELQPDHPADLGGVVAELPPLDAAERLAIDEVVGLELARFACTSGRRRRRCPSEPRHRCRSRRKSFGLLSRCSDSDGRGHRRGILFEPRGAKPGKACVPVHVAKGSLDPPRRDAIPRYSPLLLMFLD